MRALCPDSALTLASEVRFYRAQARTARTAQVPRDIARAQLFEKIARQHEARIRAYADSIIARQSLGGA